MADEEEPECCPLCMEELDLTDKTFNACPCGYQVCLWCWHQLKNEYNGLCPACRAPYTELSKHKNPLDREDVMRRTKQRRQREKNERRSAATQAPPQPPPAPAPSHPPSQLTTRSTQGFAVNRRSLANVRVMQRNLVYIIGIPQRFADDDLLRSNECVGQYGKIVKAVVNRSHLHTDRSNATASAYVTFAHKQDALACIVAIDGFCLDGSVLRASFGTTKYCNFFLRNQQCNNSECLYLHALGDQDDSFTKEEMQSALHSGNTFRDIGSLQTDAMDDVRVGSAFPPRPNNTRQRQDNESSPPHTSSSSSVSSSSGTEASAAAASTTRRGADVSRRRQSTTRSRHTAGRQSDVGSASPGPRRLSRSVSSDEPFSKIVAGRASPLSPAPASPHRKAVPTTPKTTETTDTASDGDHDLTVDTEAAAAEEAIENVVGPLEALKLATGSTLQEPAWAQPFPSAVVTPSDPDDASATLGSGDVFSPFGLGFEGGIRRPSSTNNGPSTPSPHEDVWAASSSLPTANSTPSGHPPLAPTNSTSSSFASIDAIFSQRNEKSEALAGLLGVQLSSTPLEHGTPQLGSRNSRFAFANHLGGGEPRGLGQSENPGASGMSPFDQEVNNRHSFGGYDGSGFPQLAPPPPQPSSSFSSGPGFGQSLHRTTSMPGEGSSNGLAFLQQMLPNVHISYGGEYAGRSSEGGNQDAAGGRRLFQRSHSLGGNALGWNEGLGGSTSGGNGNSGTFGYSSPSLFQDPAIVSQSTPSSFGGGFYGDGAMDEGERGLQFGGSFAVLNRQ